MRYLGDPSTRLVDKFKNIFFVFVVYALYLFAFKGLMEYLWAEKVIDIFGALVFSPFVEELIFRVAPIGLVKDKPKLILPTIILSSALFGYLHQGAISWPVQGVFGFLLALVYLKNGRSYWSVVILHFMWNLYVMTIFDKM